MLPSVLSRLFFGEAKEEEEDTVGKSEEILKKTTFREEKNDWLLISYESSAGNSNSRVNSECDLDSVCSDSSWVLTPAPTFRRSKDPTNAATVPSSSLEDLLIEHPTMSVYRQNSQQDGINDDKEEMEEENGEGATGNGEEVEQANGEEVNECWNRNRALVMQRNRHRQQLAAHLQIASPPSTVYNSTKKEKKEHPRVSRKALKRHNTSATSHLAVKRQVQKCSFKAGRRRC